MNIIHPYSAILPHNQFVIFDGSAQNFFIPSYPVSIIQPQRANDIQLVSKVLEEAKQLEKAVNFNIDKLNKQIQSNGFLNQRRNLSLQEGNPNPKLVSTQRSQIQNLNQFFKNNNYLKQPKTQIAKALVNDQASQDVSYEMKSTLKSLTKLNIPSHIQLNKSLRSSKQYDSTQKEQENKFQDKDLATSRQIITIKYPTMKSRFQIVDILGKGKFSDIYLAIEKQSSFLVSLKVIYKQTLQQYQLEQQFAREISIQMKLNHKNIIKLYGFYDDKDRIYLVLEYVPGGDLYNSIISSNKKRVTEEQSAQYMAYILEAVKYMQEQGVIHRDIKAENILLNENYLKICDFGCATTFNQEFPNRRSFCGTLDYLAPEMIMITKTQECFQRGYNYKIDNWAIGILAYEFITGKIPFFYAKSQEELQNCILNDEIIYPPHVSEEAQNFINSLLEKDPEKRMEIRDALNHQWIQKNIPKISLIEDNKLFN